MSESTAVTKADNGHTPRLSIEMERVDAVARQAAALAKSSIIPDVYRGSPSNCLVALDMANRSSLGVLTVMQNLHIIKGRPSWGSSFLIGAVNACGRFSPIRFQEEGTVGKKGWRVRAVASSKEDGETLEGPWVSWEMAEAEGWVNKSGSKWQTMPELMIRYRSAAFWARLYAPEISMGFLTADEAEDVGPPPRAHVRSIAEALDGPSEVDDQPDVEVLDGPDYSREAHDDLLSMED